MATTNNKKYSLIDLSKYNGGYKASKDVENAQILKNQAEDAVRNYGDFSYKNQAAYDEAMNAILNRKGFTYDVNGDALYQQYKDNYIRQGKLAMQDTMGQAAALTGGYGNSYATSVGNQAYQGYMAQLNDVIPELYNLALNSYNTESDRLNTNYNLLATDREAERALYTDKYNQLVADRGYYSDNYNNAYTQDYTKWTDNRNYDQSQYWNEHNAGYQADRDAVADQQWQQQFDEGKRQFDETMTFNKSQAARSGSGGGSGNTTTKSGIDISDVPEYVITKLTGFGSDNKRATYLDDLVASGGITQEQADYLYAIYKSGNKFGFDFNFGR
jgi:hypothetical protein